MSNVEIPLLRGSNSYVQRLTRATSVYASGRYHHARRTNWSSRASADFYDREVEIFRAEPDAYIAGNISVEPRVDDVYAKTMGRKGLVKICLKVATHWLFLSIGVLSSKRIRSGYYWIIRKGYVDDIELVFDADAAHVLRLVFPFPLGFKRQWRYLRRLRAEGRLFALYGNPYSISDLWRVLVSRRLGAVQRLETRAQLRLARRLAHLPARIMEMSDEFDIGCLDLCRSLHRFGFEVTNSAHGVGKYLPFHAFDRFDVLTRQQEHYYKALRPCRYTLRRLNAAPVTPPPTSPDDPINVVILGQTVAHVSPFVQDAEVVLLERVAKTLGGRPGIRLFYKPHPNDPKPDRGYSEITSVNNLGALNGHPNTIFCSFFSTCQIDPAFQGKKILINAPMIYPQIIFDPEEPIMTIDEFVAHVAAMDLL